MSAGIWISYCIGTWNLYWIHIYLIEPFLNPDLHIAAILIMSRHILDLGGIHNLLCIIYNLVLWFS